MIFVVVAFALLVFMKVQNNLVDVAHVAGLVDSK